jgi:acyl-CoA thioesterase FadM
MLLLFRFLITVGWSFFRRRVGIFGESVVRFTVLPTDCDLNVHLNAGRFVSFMDVARIELIGRARLLAPLIRRGWRPVMGGCTVLYRRSIQPFERFTIRSRCAGWDEKWFYIEHVVENANGEFAARGLMRTLIRGREGNIEPTRVLALIGEEHTPSPPLPEDAR